MKKYKKALRFLALALALLVLLPLLFACTGNQNGNQNGGGNEEGKETPPVSSHDDWQENVFFDEESGASYSVSLPWEWEIWCGFGYAILYENGKEVGRIGKYYASGASSDYENRLSDGFITERMEYEKEGEGRFIVSFSEATGEDAAYIAVDVLSNALSESDKKMLYESIGTAKPSYLDTFGGSLPSSGEILILGNSFIGSSRIGSILSSLFEAGGKDYTVNAISKGYASVVRYVTDIYYGPEIKNEIREGRYIAVFLCGFYSEDDVLALPEMVEVCREGDTPLTLLPAHNENKTLWKKGAAENNLPVLPWQSEIDALMDEGLADFFDFCIDDAHFHSTPLAGYVGASMIYRAVCGEMPQLTFWNAPLESFAVADKLGTYMQRGHAHGVTDLPLYVLKQAK